MTLNYHLQRWYPASIEYVQIAKMANLLTSPTTQARNDYNLLGRTHATDEQNFRDYAELVDRTHAIYR